MYGFCAQLEGTGNQSDIQNLKYMYFYKK